MVECKRQPVGTFLVQRELSHTHTPNIVDEVKQSLEIVRQSIAITAMHGLFNAATIKGETANALLQAITFTHIHLHNLVF